MLMVSLLAELNSLAREKGIAKTYTDSDISRMLYREELYYSPRFNFSQQDLQNHRSKTNILDRMLDTLTFSERNAQEEAYFVQSGAEAYRALENNLDYIRARNQRIVPMLRSALRKDLLNVLSGNNPSPEYSDFREVKVTREAYEKALKIARKTVELSNGPNEVYLHALDFVRENGETIISDFYIPHQKVNPSHCEIIMDKEDEDFKEIKSENKRIVGWSHSHGNHNTFHSHTDGSNLKHISYLYGHKKKVSLKTLSDEHPKTFEVFASPSIVVNSRGDPPSISISFDFKDLGSYKPQTFINEKARLKIVEQTNSINARDDFIESEILRKVISQSGFKKQKPISVTLPKTENLKEDDFFMVSYRDYMELLKDFERLKTKLERIYINRNNN